MNLNLWQRAGRLTGPAPLKVSRRGRVRPPTREEAAAMLEAALAALDAAGVPVRVMNTPNCAVVLVRGGKWRKNDNEPQSLVDLGDLVGLNAGVDNPDSL